MSKAAASQLVKKAAVVAKKLKADEAKAAIVLIETAAKLERTHKNIEKEIGDIKDAFTTHSNQDLANFRKIHDEMESTNKRFDDIVLILENQNKSVAPMLEIFNNNKITRMTMSKNGKTIVFWAGGITVIGATIAYLYDIVIKLGRPL